MVHSTSVHVRSLLEQPPVVEAEGGSIQRLTVAEFPILDGLSISRVILAPATAREPQWTVRGEELGYCLRGRAVVTLALDGGAVHRFRVETGQMYFVPPACMVAIENVGDDEVEILATIADASPSVFGLSTSLAFMTDAVIGNTFGFGGDALADRTHGKVDRSIVRVAAPSPGSRAEAFNDPYWFDVEHAPFVGNPDVGGAREAKKMFWPILEGISMFSLSVTDVGMREAHWHPMTVEMGYVARGRARMSVLDPDGSWDTYELDAGDLYFVPRSYPHMIEDIGVGDIHFLIFFDRHTSGDIGYRVPTAGLDPALAAATFGVPVPHLPELPVTRNDPQFVPRVNPVD